MALFHAVLIGAVCLVIQGLDIIGFFMMIRLITLRWQLRPLLAFDQVGRPLVDPLMAAVQRAIPVEWLGLEPRRTWLMTAAALLAVALCRLALNPLTQAVLIPF